MSNNERSYWQSHEIAGYRAEVVVKWKWPEGSDPPANWLGDAEELAEMAFSAVHRLPYEIVMTMRGKTLDRIECEANKIAAERDKYKARCDMLHALVLAMIEGADRAKAELAGRF